MHATPQLQEHNQTTVPPSQSSEDYYASLVNVIAEAANDPARVRKLVYAVVRSNLNPETVFAPSMPDATWQAKTLFELDQAFQIERAIKRLEERSAPRRSAWRDRYAYALPPVPADPVAAAPEPLPSWTAPEPEYLPPPEVALPPPEPVLPPAPEPQISRAAILAALEAVARELPQQARAAPRNDRPVWVVPAAEILSNVSTVTRAQRLWAAWLTLPAYVHAVAAALIAAAFITGISGWFQHSGGVTADTARTAAPAVSVALKSARIMETVGHAPPRPPEPSAAQPFPALQSFGVYAANNGLLTQLDPLPVNIAMGRMAGSADISQPSRTALAGDKLSFIVFDRDFANGAPQTVSARVVGHVSRLVRFVDGRARVTPYAGPWRLRDKSYEFKVSQLEGRDIMVIRPDRGTVLPAGRYALVINGRGYDFTVAGRVTAPEQCLEQTEVVNGVVVGDCTNI